jgi:hypothetical protein
MRRIVIGLTIALVLETTALAGLWMEHRVLSVRVEALAGVLQGVEREVQTDTDDEESTSQLLDELKDACKKLRGRAPQPGVKL